MNKTQSQRVDMAEKFTQLEELVESYKNKTKDRVNDGQEQ